MASRLLVTGATGFVGTWTLRHWRAEYPDVELWATSNEPCRDETGVAHFVQLDLLDREGARELVASCRPDQVIHLAGIIGDADLAEHLRVNVAATDNLYHALLEAAPVDDLRIVQASSAAAYGVVQPEELPITENQTPRPISAYGLSKLTQDYLAMAMWHKWKLPVICGRLFNVLGPGQPDSLVPMAFVKRLKELQVRGGNCLKVGNTESRRDFVDVRDVAAAFAALLRRGDPGQLYNIGSGEDVSIQAIVDKLLPLSGLRVRVGADTSFQRRVDVPCVRADIGKISAKTAWRPRIPLDKSLEAMWQECRV